MDACPLSPVVTLLTICPPLLLLLPAGVPPTRLPAALTALPLPLFAEPLLASDPSWYVVVAASPPLGPLSPSVLHEWPSPPSGAAPPSPSSPCDGVREGDALE